VEAQRRLAARTIAEVVLPAARVLLAVPEDPDERAAA
jgi:hypothetical protein